MTVHPLAAVSRLPGVAAVVDEVRTVCETVRWHRGLRRRWEVARTEAGLRAAAAGLELDGVRVPLDAVRETALGLRAPEGVEGAAVLGALRVQSDVERGMPAPGSPGPAPAVPLGQLLSRWHALAVGPRRGPEDARVPAHEDVPAHKDVPGRLRGDVAPADLRGLGAAPSAVEVEARLELLADLLRRPVGPDVPGLVVASVALGELLTLRPFVRGNGAVARAMFRRLLTVHGVDPVGVVVPETAWAPAPAVHLSAAAHFATGRPDGVAAWVAHCGEAVVRGAQEGISIADGVLAGRWWAVGSPSAD